MNIETEWSACAAALKGKERVRILALESSCDETAAAVVENGRTVLSGVIFSRWTYTPCTVAWCRKSPAARTWTRVTG